MKSDSRQANSQCCAAETENRKDAEEMSVRSYRLEPRSCEDVSSVSRVCRVFQASCKEILHSSSILCARWALRASKISALPDASPYDMTSSCGCTCWAFRAGVVHSDQPRKRSPRSVVSASRLEARTS